MNKRMNNVRKRGRGRQQPRRPTSEQPCRDQPTVARIRGAASTPLSQRRVRLLCNLSRGTTIGGSISGQVAGAAYLRGEGGPDRCCILALNCPASRVRGNRGAIDYEREQHIRHDRKLARSAQADRGRLRRYGRLQPSHWLGRHGNPGEAAVSAP